MPFFGPPRRMNCLSLSSLVVECAGPAPQRPLCFCCLSVHSPAYEGETERRFNVLLLFSVEYFFPEGKWAALGGSAIPRQPVAGTRQDSFPQPSSKNQFNI